MITRAPHPCLQPFVSVLWANTASAVSTAYEHVIPTGETHMVFRLETPLAIREHQSWRIVGQALVGGARSSFYVRELSHPSRSVGVMLRPGATEALFGVPASELAESHTSLVDLWGNEALQLQQRLASMTDPMLMLLEVERELQVRLPSVRGLHPAVAYALRSFDDSFMSVSDVVARGGVSHRRFIANFRRAVGLTPKTYLRLRRFQAALARMKRGDGDLLTTALECGYCDQSHLNRDFSEFAGVSPHRYLARSTSVNHVPIL